MALTKSHVSLVRIKSWMFEDCWEFHIFNEECGIPFVMSKWDRHLCAVQPGFQWNTLSSWHMAADRVLQCRSHWCAPQGTSKKCTNVSRIWLCLMGTGWLLLHKYSYSLVTCSFLNYSSKMSLSNIEHENLCFECVKQREWCKHN